jgi:hypothetical protein
MVIGTGSLSASCFFFLSGRVQRALLPTSGRIFNPAAFRVCLGTSGIACFFDVMSRFAATPGIRLFRCGEGLKSRYFREAVFPAFAVDRERRGGSLHDAVESFERAAVGTQG